MELDAAVGDHAAARPDAAVGSLVVPDAADRPLRVCLDVVARGLGCGAARFPVGRRSRGSARAAPAGAFVRDRSGTRAARTGAASRLVQDPPPPSAGDARFTTRRRCHGVHKWIAYDRVTGEVIGRGGLSRTPIDDDWCQIYAYLPAEPWVRAAHESQRPFVAHANWLEIGWALRREFWGRGYASEIGRAGLAFAFDVLGVQAVVSCTVRHNVRSRAVMKRIGMRYAGEIRSRGLADGLDGVQDDAPFAVCVLLRSDWQG